MARPLTWSTVLGSLLVGTDLDPSAARWAMDEVMSGRASDAQMAAFLVLLRAKGETVDELRSIADGMLAHARPFETGMDCVDIVGTGGDQAQTVNISTMSSLVVAGCGVPVVKHGNRAASSRSGSADVIEALGVDLTLGPDQLAEVLRRVGMTFCFAQTFHPSMRHAASPRKELGIPTTFNVLGPLTNPARPRWSAIGCALAPMAPLMAGVLAARGGEAAVFRGSDGLDEVTTAGTTQVWWVSAGQVTELEVDPRRLGLPLHPVEALRGGQPLENADIARRVLGGERGAVRDAVLLNAGMALAVVGASSLAARPTQEELDAHLGEAVARAAGCIDDGDATRLLEGWAAATHEVR